MNLPSKSGPTRACAAVAVWVALGGGALAAGGCGEGNPGEDPPDEQLFFPSGLLLDPRAGPDERARYLFVANGNNDLGYNTGTIAAIDLDRFFRAWSLPSAGAPDPDQDAPDPFGYAVDPYCQETACMTDDDCGPSGPCLKNCDTDAKDADEREECAAEQGSCVAPCVLDVGSDVTGRLPCRRLALLPQVVECDEAPFIVASQRVGDFATLLTHSCEDDDPALGRGGCREPRLWLPIRGDPSVVYLDIDGGPQSVPVFDCHDDGPDEGTDDDLNTDRDGECRGRNRLRFLRNDDTLTELPREPFNMVVSPSQRLAYVTHADGVGLSLIDLDGIDDGTGRSSAPALVEMATVFRDPGGTTGGFGLAERPCNPNQSPPSITLGCERPLVYGGFRYSRLLTSFTVQGVDNPMPGQCAGVDELDQPGKISCDERVRSQRLIFPGGLDPSSTGFRPILGDLAFADARGDELLVLQTGPGALLKLDTHVDVDGEPVDTPSVPPLELCDEPSRMRLFEDDGERYALVSCFRAALIYVVDLQGFRVLDTIVAGTGPYELEVDQVRKLLYVANNLEGSITIIDLARDRPTRFREIARIGLQEPFSR